jgi:tetratricopeptide (TPR) repeat protein
VSDNVKNLSVPLFAGIFCFTNYDPDRRDDMRRYCSAARHAARIAIVALVATSVWATSARAQGKGKKNEGPACTIDNQGAIEMSSAQLFLQKATDPKTDTASKFKALKQAIGTLTPADNKMHNDLGQAYMLGEAMATWVATPGAELSGPKSDYGFKADPTTQIDALHFTDSLFKRVIRDKPGCEAYLDQLRQGAYVPLVNKAIQALNASQYDSAQTFANQSLSIYGKSPYAYNVLGGVAVRRNDLPTAAKDYDTVIQLAGPDTLYTRLKNSALYNLAVVTQAEADTAKAGPERKALRDSSLALWKAYTAINPTDGNGKAGLAHALQAVGDTLSAEAMTKAMVSNPQQYTDVQIFQAALNAARDDRTADAAQLFKAGLSRNPYFRDALAYVAGEYAQAGKVDSLFPLARRLMDIDPSNPDSYQLMAYAYQLKAHNDKVPAVKKADQDTLLSYFSKYQNAPVKLSVTKFGHDGDKVMIAGTVENRTDAAKTWPIKFEFLDATGKVIATQDVPPLTVDPKGTKSFSVSVEQPGIAAYKYEPLK